MSAIRTKNAHLWERHTQDWYVEPEWCSRRLFDVENFPRYFIADPACGLGRILDSAKMHGYETHGSDIIKRSQWCERTRDFLTTGYDPAQSIVSNPPFRIADEFAKHALTVTRFKVALLMPIRWLSSAKRGEWLETTPLRRVWLLAPRPSMPPGPVIEAGINPGNGTTDFAWIVWEHGYFGRPELRWLRRDK